MAQVSHVMTSIPEVLERIFDHLSVLDLLRFQLVCKSWRSSSLVTLQKRKRVIKSEILTSIQFWEDEDYFVHKTSTRTRSWNKESEVYQELATWRRSWYALPQLVLCVCQINDKDKNKLQENVEDVLRCWLPPECKILVVGTIDSVVCSEAEKSTTEMDVDDIRKFYNAISLPVNHSDFAINVIALEEKSKQGKKEFLQSLQLELAETDLKMILALVRLRQHGPRSWLMDELEKAAEKNIVVTGCLFDSGIFFGPADNENSSLSSASNAVTSQEMVILSFKGKNVDVASVMIESDVNTLAQLDQELLKLQATMAKFSQNCPSKCGNRTAAGKCHDCDSQALAFMIACCSRANAVSWYQGVNDDPRSGTYNVEQASFRAKFPKIPIFGTFGVGEIGGSFNLNQDNTESRSKIDDDLLNGECTIFTVVLLK